MKVLLLTDGIYPYTIGGMQKHSYYLAKFLAREGVILDVLIPTIPVETTAKLEDYLTLEEQKKINFIEINQPKVGYFPGHYIYESYKYSKNIYNQVIDHIDEYDFVYAQGFTAWKLLKERSDDIKRLPIGVNFHGLEMFQITDGIASKMEQFLFRSPARYCLNKADYAYSLGGKLTDIIDRETDGNTDILQTPIGIEDYWLENVHLNIERPRRFVFIGRYEKRKGIDLLNNVIEKNYSGDFYFDFIGPIPEEKRVDFPNVYYHGAIYEENRIIKILNQGDVLFCPSYSEGMPTVILEAMSRGLAVVATDVGAVNCLVSSQTGWLIEPGDQELLDKTFKECINIGEEELIDKKRAAHQLIKEEYTWTNIAKINKQAILSAVEE
ncbi:hypothetical protein Asal01_00460 [Fodinibius salicampi]|nr:glycosyltransferase family 4 protein [Fodinibius salicampi]